MGKFNKTSDNTEYLNNNEKSVLKPSTSQSKDKLRDSTENKIDITTKSIREFNLKKLNSEFKKSTHENADNLKVSIDTKASLKQFSDFNTKKSNG